MPGVCLSSRPPGPTDQASGKDRKPGENAFLKGKPQEGSSKLPGGILVEAIKGTRVGRACAQAGLCSRNLEAPSLAQPHPFCCEE